MSEPDASLALLEDRKVGKLSLRLNNVRRPVGREKECRSFELYLETTDSELSVTPVIWGLFNTGRRSLNIKSYFDVEFNYLPRFLQSRALDLTLNGVDYAIFDRLSSLVELGGKMIVGVAGFPTLPLLEETFLLLDRGVPPESTYAGNLLYRCGCGDSYRLWLLREGGREGPPALEGDKVITEQERAKSRTNLVERMQEFLHSPTSLEDWAKPAVGRASMLLSTLSERGAGNKT